VTDRLKNLNRTINNCKRCRLWQQANKAVPGEGPENAKIMLVGQNPGAKEDATGRPFVGLSGIFLNEVLLKSDLKRSELFITGVVKHKTPRNRYPEKDEVKACLPYLFLQIRIIKPKVIVLMGRLARQIPRLPKIKYFITYHPQAARRFPKIRPRFMADFAALKKFMAQDQKITVYTTAACPYCQMTKKYLAEKNIDFVEKDVTSDEKAAGEMISRTGQMSVPVIIIEKDGREDLIIGFDKEKLDHLLNLQ